jgi:hypothetical protein
MESYAFKKITKVNYILYINNCKYYHGNVYGETFVETPTAKGTKRSLAGRAELGNVLFG